MKLVTFQTQEALQELITKGILVCDKKYINFDKVGYAYNYIKSAMSKKITPPDNGIYPMWAWVKCFNGICPPKIKKTSDQTYIKITFNKPDNQVFVTDFEMYSFVLNNTYIPKDKSDKTNFDNLLAEKNITKEELLAYSRRDKFPSHRTDRDYIEICNKIYQSFDRIINSDGEILQGCVWDIKLGEVEKIEFINDPDYSYGSLNYIRANGKRFDWINNYYKKLK